MPLYYGFVHTLSFWALKKPIKYCETAAKEIVSRVIQTVDIQRHPIHPKTPSNAIGQIANCNSKFTHKNQENTAGWKTIMSCWDRFIDDLSSQNRKQTLLQGRSALHSINGHFELMDHCGCVMMTGHDLKQGAVQMIVFALATSIVVDLPAAKVQLCCAHEMGR